MRFVFSVSFIIHIYSVVRNVYNKNIQRHMKLES
jgi:hypothetical protein